MSQPHTPRRVTVRIVKRERRAPLINVPDAEEEAPLFCDEFAPYLAEQLRDPKVRAAYEQELRNATRPPRRRWWHRFTRRNP